MKYYIGFILLAILFLGALMFLASVSGSEKTPVGIWDVPVRSIDDAGMGLDKRDWDMPDDPEPYIQEPEEQYLYETPD